MTHAVKKVKQWLNAISRIRAMLEGHRRREWFPVERLIMLKEGIGKLHVRPRARSELSRPGTAWSPPPTLPCRRWEVRHGTHPKESSPALTSSEVYFMWLRLEPGEYLMTSRGAQEIDGQESTHYQALQGKRLR